MNLLVCTHVLCTPLYISIASLTHTHTPCVRDRHINYINALNTSHVDKGEETNEEDNVLLQYFIFSLKEHLTTLLLMTPRRYLTHDADT